jgi:hypothetical protein
MATEALELGPRFTLVTLAFIPILIFLIACQPLATQPSAMDKAQSTAMVTEHMLLAQLLELSLV